MLSPFFTLWCGDIAYVTKTSWAESELLRITLAFERFGDALEAKVGIVDKRHHSDTTADAFDIRTASSGCGWRLGQVLSVCLTFDVADNLDIGGGRCRGRGNVSLGGGGGECMWSSSRGRRRIGIRNQVDDFFRMGFVGGHGLLVTQVKCQRREVGGFLLEVRIERLKVKNAAFCCAA